MTAMRGPFFYLPVALQRRVPVVGVPVRGRDRADWRGRRSTLPEAGSAHPRTLLWLWIVVIVVFFSLSAAKQDLYIFPIVPAVARSPAIVIARRTAQEPRAGRAIRITTAIDRRHRRARGRWRPLPVPRRRDRVTRLRRIADAVLSASPAAPRSRCSPWHTGLRAALVAVAVDASSSSTGSSCCACCRHSKRTSRRPRSRARSSRAQRQTPSSPRMTKRCPSLVFYLRRHVEQLFDRGPRARRCCDRRETRLRGLSRDDYAAHRCRAIGADDVRASSDAADVRRQAEDGAGAGAAAGSAGDESVTRIAMRIADRAICESIARAPRPSLSPARISPPRCPRRGWQGVRRRASVAPAAKASASVPITVSPAPVTSATSRASAGGAVSSLGVSAATSRARRA